MKSNPKFSKERKDNIEEISYTFGRPKKDDKKIKDGENIFYKEKEYNVIAADVPFPDNKEELKKIEDILSDFEQDNIKEDYSEIHSFFDASPYENCATYLQNLLQETKVKLKDFIVELESNNFTSDRLEKPNYIGFYRPFHFWPRSWGIYLNKRMINREGAEIFAYNNRRNVVPGLTFQDARRLSFFHTYFHEMYHHKFELLGTKFEMSLRKPVYTECFHKFYCETLDTDYCLEEAFANVFGLNKAIKYMYDKQFLNYPKSEIKQLLREAILYNAPRGYRVAYEITGLDDQDAEKYFENQFLEILLDFCHRTLFNNQAPVAVDPMTWDIFTYRLDPLINSNNTVTFVV